MLITSPSAPLPLPLLSILRRARRLAVFTGSGPVVDSEVRAFCGEFGNLWEPVGPAGLAGTQVFLAQPDAVWGWHEWCRDRVLRAQPAASHRAIASMARYVDSLTIATQNVDDLHERAGGGRILHLHGSLMTARCSACERPYRFAAGTPMLRPGQWRQAPPTCIDCEALIRPGVVWPGEDLPELAWSSAYGAARKSDVLFMVGASGVAFPLATVPDQARRAGALVVQINTQPTKLDALAHFNLLGSADDLLPRIAAQAWAGQGRETIMKGWHY